MLCYAQIYAWFFNLVMLHDFPILLNTLPIEQQITPMRIETVGGHSRPLSNFFASTVGSLLLSSDADGGKNN